MEIEGKVAVKHRQHIIATSFMLQQEPRAAEYIVEPEASRPTFRSGAQVTEGGRSNKVLHAHS